MEEAARINELTQALIRVLLEPAKARTVDDKLAEEGYTTIDNLGTRLEKEKVTVVLLNELR